VSCGIVAFSKSFVQLRPPRNVLTMPAPPKFWRRELAFVLIEQREIQRRVSELARRIQRDYRSRELVILALLNGTIMFLSDLIRHLEMPLRLDFIGVSSYGSRTESGKVVFTKELKLDVGGRDVLLLDDILDTGRTLKHVQAKVRKLRPRSMKVCVLLNKKSRRMQKIEADYVGFEIPDHFVVGYGLDYAERYRNLPFVAVLQEHIYSESK
jgi:hypoxanthine phosphoribosyltransferase